MTCKWDFHCLGEECRSGLGGYFIFPSTAFNSRAHFSFTRHNFAGGLQVLARLGEESQALISDG